MCGVKCSLTFQTFLFRGGSRWGEWCTEKNTWLTGLGTVHLLKWSVPVIYPWCSVLVFSASAGGVQCSGSGKSLLVSSLEIVHSHLADYTAQTGLTGLTGRRAELIQAARSVLLELLSEQDDSLVEALTACCHLSSFHHTYTCRVAL